MELVKLRISKLLFYAHYPLFDIFLRFFSSNFRYSVTSGCPEKILEYLLDNIILSKDDNTKGYFLN